MMIEWLFWITGIAWAVMVAVAVWKAQDAQWEKYNGPKDKYGAEN